MKINVYFLTFKCYLKLCTLLALLYIGKTPQNYEYQPKHL